jgi:hypothetical protein
VEIADDTIGVHDGVGIYFKLDSVSNIEMKKIGFWSSSSNHQIIKFS